MIYTTTDVICCFPGIALRTGEWLGNVLEQAPATQDEREDV